MTDRPRGFIWYELLTSDMDAAESFYRAVIGWSARDSGIEGMRYTLLSAGDRAVAGLMTLPAEDCPEGAHPGWIGYIEADDTDRATAAVVDAGGAQLRAPETIPGVGRFSVVADPQGAAYVLFKPEGEDAPPAPPCTPGHVGWHELCALDGAAAFDFYAGLYGWTRDTAHDMGPMGVYQLFAAGDGAIGGIMNKPEDVPAPSWLFYFNTDSAEAAGARVAANGGSVINGPMEVPGGSWIIQCVDPQGAVFALAAPVR